MGCRRKRVGQWNEIFYSLRLLAAAKEKIHPAKLGELGWLGELGELGELGGLGDLGELGELG